MAILPGLDALKDDLNLTAGQVRILASLSWILIILNSALLTLIIINIWQILVK